MWVRIPFKNVIYVSVLDPEFHSIFFWFLWAWKKFNGICTLFRRNSRKSAKYFFYVIRIQLLPLLSSRNWNSNWKSLKLPWITHKSQTTFCQKTISQFVNQRNLNKKAIKRKSDSVHALQSYSFTSRFPNVSHKEKKEKEFHMSADNTHIFLCFPKYFPFLFKTHIILYEILSLTTFLSLQNADFFRCVFIYS